MKNTIQRYDNGELVTKPRIEDEPWYAEVYQPFLEFLNLGEQIWPDVGLMYEEALEYFASQGDVMYWDNNKNRLLRYCVLHFALTQFRPDDDIDPAGGHGLFSHI